MKHALALALATGKGFLKLKTVLGTDRVKQGLLMLSRQGDGWLG